MIFSVIGMAIGALILSGCIYFYVKEKNDLESRKIYSIIGGVAAVIFIVMLIKVLLKI